MVFCLSMCVVYVCVRAYACMRIPNECTNRRKETTIYNVTKLFYNQYESIIKDKQISSHTHEHTKRKHDKHQTTNKHHKRGEKRLHAPTQVPEGVAGEGEGGGRGGGGVQRPRSASWRSITCPS